MQCAGQLESAEQVVCGIGTTWEFGEKEREKYTGEFEVVCRIRVARQQLRKTKCVVAAASGKAKCHAILGTLQTGLVNILVVDEQAAEAVCLKAGV